MEDDEPNANAEGNDSNNVGSATQRGNKLVSQQDDDFDTDL